MQNAKVIGIKLQTLNMVCLLIREISGILSLVMDTFDLWRAITEYCVKAKDIILARDGKLVIRPDSGDPVDILCG
jgi:nicotinic acid phosphoribosyltransferase